MQQSASITNLAKAIALFHSNMGKVKKDSTNPHFKNKYASLSTILEKIKAPLAAAGLTFVQFPDENDTLTTCLIHAETGEFMQASYTLNAQKRDPQGIGSAITYARRYALGAILGLDIDDDDDAQAATDPYGLTYASQDKVLELVAKAHHPQQLVALYSANQKIVAEKGVKEKFTARKEELSTAA